jgi:hypothetical protein
MSTPTPITNHVLQGISKMLTPYRNRPRFAAWCKAPLTQVQELENVAADFLTLLDVDTADLPRLVLLGKIVGQNERGTLEQFRRLVKVRVLVNRSRGRAPDLIKIARILLSPLGDPLGEINYTEGGCNILIEAVDGVSDLDASTAVEFLRLAKMAGVGLYLIASTHDDGLLWATAAEALASRATPDAVHGFALPTLLTGGYTAQFR